MKNLTILISIITISFILAYSRYNGSPYHVIDRFALNHGDIHTFVLHDNQILFRNNQAICRGNIEKEITLSIAGNYKIIELKK